MKKVYVVIVDGKPYAFTSKGQLHKELAGMKLSVEPTIHECEIQKRVYTRKKDEAPF